MDERFRRVIVSCVEKAMQAEKFSKMKVDFTGTNKKGEGFVADMLFVVVTETDMANKYKEVRLALKIGKRNKDLRENLPEVIEFYQRESVFYDTVLPVFRQFQLERDIVNIFDAVPKCYGTVLSDDIEALVLEDLRRRGFALHNKLSTMNLPHLHLVLKNYAKFHAISLALRDQDKDKFDKVFANYYSVYKKLLPKWIRPQSDPRVLMVLREAGRGDLAAKYEEETKNNELTRLQAILEDVPQESVIHHGDCHNNNFLFEYKGEDKENPLSVAILDWQLSGIHSPVLDISYFLYNTASRKDLFQMDDLLKFYHQHLTDFLTQLGSDAQKVFPYSTLVEHWRKYSVFGFIIAKSALQTFHIPEDQTPEISGNKDDQDAWKNIKLENEDLYTERLISGFDHFFNTRLTGTNT